MKLFTVSFFGHRIVPEFREAEERVEALIHTLLLENEYVEFLVGRNGDFDQIVTSKYVKLPPGAIQRALFRFATSRWWIEAILWCSMWIIPAVVHIKPCVTHRERTKII